MRVVSWLFVICTLLGMIGVFTSNIEVGIKSKHATMSLYRAQADRKMAARLLASYSHTKSRHVGAAIMGFLMPRSSGAAHEILDDTLSAMSELDDVSPADAEKAGVALAIVTWGYMAFQVIGFGLVLVGVVNGVYRRWRLAIAALTSLITGMVAVAVHLGCREIVAEANDEIGASVFEVGLGSYTMLVAGIAGFLCAAALVVLTFKGGGWKRYPRATP